MLFSPSYRVLLARCVLNAALIVGAAPLSRPHHVSQAQETPGTPSADPESGGAVKFYRLKATATTDTAELRQFLWNRAVETWAESYQLWTTLYTNRVEELQRQIDRTNIHTADGLESYKNLSLENLATKVCNARVDAEGETLAGLLKSRTRLFAKGLDKLAVEWSADYRLEAGLGGNGHLVYESNAVLLGGKLNCFQPDGTPDCLLKGVVDCTERMESLLRPTVPRALAMNKPFGMSVKVPLGAFGSQGVPLRCKPLGILGYEGRSVTKVGFTWGSKLSGYWLIGKNDTIEKAVLALKTDTARLNCEGPLGTVTVSITLVGVSG